MAIDIQKIARAGAKVGFGLIGGILKSGTLVVNSNTGGTYDPATDTRTGASSTYSLKGFFYQSNEQQAKDSSANTGMMMFEAAAVIAAGLSAIPDEADQWIMDGVTWSVERVDADPATAVYLVQIAK